MKVKVESEEEFHKKHPKYRPREKSKSEYKREEYMARVRERKKEGLNK